jgi:hypothetical protein
VRWWIEVLGFALTAYSIGISALIVGAGMYLQVFRIIDHGLEESTVYKLIYFTGMSVVMGAAFYLITKDDDVQT